MMIWIFFAVVIAGSLIAQYTISAFVVVYGGALGIQAGNISLYPPWLVELHISFFWYSWVFSALNRRLFDITKKNTYKWDVKSYVGKLFFAYLVISNTLRFALGFDILISYLITLLVVIVIPLYLAFLFHPVMERHEAKSRITGKEMKEIALKNPLACQFMAHYPQSKTYIFENQNKHDIGTCILLFRREREERNEIWEDILLEIPIDMKKKEPLNGSEKFHRYIFSHAEEGSCVLELSPEGILERDVIDKPLEKFDLDRFDSLFARFPPLQEIPLPIAVSGESYEVVENES